MELCGPWQAVLIFRCIWSIGFGRGGRVMAVHQKWGLRYRAVHQFICRFLTYGLDMSIYCIWLLKCKFVVLKVLTRTHSYSMSEDKRVRSHTASVPFRSDHRFSSHCMILPCVKSKSCEVTSWCGRVLFYGSGSLVFLQCSLNILSHGWYDVGYYRFPCEI